MRIFAIHINIDFYFRKANIPLERLSPPPGWRCPGSVRVRTDQDILASYQSGDLHDPAHSHHRPGLSHLHLGKLLHLLLPL